MSKIRNFITNHSLLILIISILLLIPATIGYINTKINYDILVYLPDNIDTIKGENILTNDFKVGSYAFVILENMSGSDALKIENKIKKIDGINEVLSIYDILGTTIPESMLPSSIKDKLYKDNTTILFTTIASSSSSTEALDAIEELRSVVKDSTKVSSMSAMVLDTMNLSNKEVFAYVLIAIIFCLTVLLITTDSYLIPFLLLINIGVAIIYNLGTNLFLGNISYITKAITAILQLGVTMDFSIFLYHKYEQHKNTIKNSKEAMSLAIKDTFKSVIGSALTTVAGFLALCFMELTLGLDIGIVMAKGVVFGFITVLTLFPSLLLIFDKYIDKTKHKNIFPSFNILKEFIIKRHKLILLIFACLLVPVIIGNSRYKVYYKLDDSLPDDLAFKVANKQLKEKFNIVTPYIILVDKNIDSNSLNELTTDLKNIDGIDLVLAPSSLITHGVDFIFNDNLKALVNNSKYNLVLVNSKYELASEELNNQISKLEKVVKKYDSGALIAGEGPLMKDLVEISDHDFKMVNTISILVIFIIMMFVLKSFPLAVLIVTLIEFAIFFNMSIAYYTNVSLPFISSIVVGTIQLGATIDYAILLSTKYIEERKNEKDKYKAMKKTLNTTVSSIIVSALCFFAATVGVFIYTKIDMIGSICELLSRGSIISMISVITILPSLLLVFDKLFIKKEEK